MRWVHGMVFFPLSKNGIDNGIWEAKLHIPATIFQHTNTWTYHLWFKVCIRWLILLRVHPEKFCALKSWVVNEKDKELDFMSLKWVISARLKGRKIGAMLISRWPKDQAAVESGNFVGSPEDYERIQSHDTGLVLTGKWKFSPAKNTDRPVIGSKWRSIKYSYVIIPN